jgi:hypothetical protein
MEKHGKIPGRNRTAGGGILIECEAAGMTGGSGGDIGLIISAGDERGKEARGSASIVGLVGNEESEVGVEEAENGRRGAGWPA